MCSLNSRMLCARYSWNSLSGSGEEFLKIITIYFCYLGTISGLKGTWSYILRKLNSRHPRSFNFCKFGWNWQILTMYFSLFCYYLPLKKGIALLLNKLDSPLPNNALLNWPSGSVEKKLNYLDVFSLFRYHLSLGKFMAF